MSLVTYVGGAESDSFATVAEVEDYFAEIEADTSVWEGYSLGEKEFRLQLAAQMLGHLPLRGRVVFRNQSLCFPRTCQPYGSRFKIPMEAKRAQALVALQVIPPTVVSPGQEASYGLPTSVSIGGLLSASFGSTSHTASILERFTSQVPFPVYMLLKKFIAQIRGGAVLNADEAPTLSTTTSHPPVTTTTAPAVTTTTSV
jgi:hypothetical protein